MHAPGTVLYRSNDPSPVPTETASATGLISAVLGHLETLIPAITSYAMFYIAPVYMHADILVCIHACIHAYIHT